MPRPQLSPLHRAWHKPRGNTLSFWLHPAREDALLSPGGQGVPVCSSTAVRAGTRRGPCQQPVSF